MKLIIYYLALLIFVAVITGFTISENGNTMAMQQMIGVSGALVLYTVGMSLIGQGPSEDEREVLHKYISNRAGLIAGTIVFAVGIIYQLFVTHNIDYWLLVGLITINLTKIISLIYLNYRK